MERNVIIAEGNAAAAAGRPIENVIFDFGNVLVGWDPQAPLRGRYSPAFIADFFDNEVSGTYTAFDMADRGMPLDDVHRYVEEHSGRRWAEAMRYYHEHFDESLRGVVPGARLLVEQLRQAGIGVWGLSNWDVETFPEAEKAYPILSSLDGRVVSGFVGMIKPHRDIYEKALDQFGIAAATALFVDDKAVNVAGANEAGIRGLQFSEPEALRHALVEAGVPLPEPLY